MLIIQRRRFLIKPKEILFMNRLGRICPFGVVELIVVETLGKRIRREEKTLPSILVIVIITSEQKKQ
ncbi:MAG: branched-subunit amino acid transport protein AzlD [Bacillariaceae sp.]|jgi:branched-subunit amino acid transport protein AzlD